MNVVVYSYYDQGREEGFGAGMSMVADPNQFRSQRSSFDSEEQFDAYLDGWYTGYNEAQIKLQEDAEDYDGWD